MIWSFRVQIKRNFFDMFGYVTILQLKLFWNKILPIEQNNFTPRSLNVMELKMFHDSNFSNIFNCVIVWKTLKNVGIQNWIFQHFDLKKLCFISIFYNTEH